MPEIVVLGASGFFHHAEPLRHHFGERMVIEADYSPSKVAAYHPDLVITFEASNPQRGLVVAEMMRRNVATLLIMDGIQEWRNTWSRIKGGNKRPLNQPILTHKVACLGRLDARLYESWGNVGKCEIVGAPRLDDLVMGNYPMRTQPIEGRPLRLLVMTARTPGFTPEEREITLQSLRDLRDHLKPRKDIEVVWRLSKGLHLELRVENTFTSATGEELHQLLPQMDAVITTPSTAQLEAMLVGLPVALLNYHLVPVYTPAAWEIKCSDHIEPVLKDLCNPPFERMLYQDFCLHDALECRTPALPRLIQLVETMIKIRKEQHSKGTPLSFPARILDSPEYFVSWPSEAFDLERLYPDHPVFRLREVTFLQSELDAALITIEQLKEQVNTLTHRLHRIPGYTWLSRLALSFQRRFHLGGHYQV
jgi:hypothetical protein